MEHKTGPMQANIGRISIFYRYFLKFYLTAVGREKTVEVYGEEEKNS